MTATSATSDDILSGERGMICPSCGSEGSYQEIEDLSHDGEWIYPTAWQCHGCDVYLSQWEDGFEWGDD